MSQPKKLIEVAMPVKEVSAESIRDKSIRHGHISTLHLWWARRPLPVCRAVVFASLVPDPLDPDCPQAFRDAVEILLGKKNNMGDPYMPYEDIPYTSAIDKMEDNLRNRLLMFIGKFSDEYARNEKGGRATQSNKQISDFSLIKWDNKNNEVIINKARKLIWVAQNAKNGAKAEILLTEFDQLYKAINEAEQELFSILDRHLTTKETKAKDEALQKAIDAFLDKMPKVFDPFAGGGAIPLEAARLGCQSYGNDINPVAHIIQKGSLEYPHKYGKSITYSKKEFITLYGEEIWKAQSQQNRVIKNGEVIAVRIENRLAFDVEFFANRLLKKVFNEVGHLYPKNKGKDPVAYYWVKEGTCSNPTCRTKVPLLKGFYLAKTDTKKVYLNPIIKNNRITFEIKRGDCTIDGWVSKNNFTCPICGNITNAKSLKAELESKGLSERLLAVIEEGEDGKTYRLPLPDEINISAPASDPIQDLLPKALTGGSIMSWGYKKWGQMFSPRQLFTLQSFCAQVQFVVEEIALDNNYYKDAIATYLAILIDRLAMNLTSFGIWKPSGEFISAPFSKQAIPMVFDYPESNPFCKSTGSAFNQIDWITRYIKSESSNHFATVLKNASSGEREQFDEKSITATITDPPYYDAIAYADLSDFFYVWLKRTLYKVYPLNFATPQTPKSDECTALKHHRNGSVDEAKSHFESKLLQIFDAIEVQTSDIVSIMFAHQTTEAWTTLCNSILGARMNITGSWSMDSERDVRTLALAGSALESSVTVSCRPSFREGLGEFKEIKNAIENTVAREVDELYRLGFRGADLLTACFGQAVSVFGNYEKVEKADGSKVEVAELLKMARESAFEALVKGYEGDEYTRFYIGWLQLYGFSETDFDDVNSLVKVGLKLETKNLFKEHILVKNVNKQTLATLSERVKLNKKLGESVDSFLIDQVHRAMALYKGTNRSALLNYLSKVAGSPENNFWRVATSLDELLPKGSDDHKQVNGLLTNKDSLIRESKLAQASTSEQAQLFE